MTTVAGDRRARTRGERQRELILDVVAELLETVPIAELSVGQITTRAGITRSAFYFYFDSKYAAVAVALSDVLTDLTTSTREFDRNPGEPFSDYVRRTVAIATQVWQRHGALLNACVQARESDPQLRQMWDQLIDTIVDLIAAIAEDERSDGAAFAHPDIHELARVLGGMTVWALHEDRVRSASPERRAHTVDVLSSVWLSAMVAGTPPQ